MGVFCKNCPFPSRALPIPEKTFFRPGRRSPSLAGGWEERTCLVMGPGKGGRGKTGERRCRSFFSLALASGPLEYLWKYGTGPSCDEEADPSGSPLIMGGTLFVQRNVLCGCREVKACLGIPGSDAGGTRGAARGCCLIAGLERRGEAGRSETRAGYSGAGKADAVQGAGMACSGLCQACPVVGIARVELSPRSSFRAGGGPQDAKKPSMWRASSFPMADRLSGLSSGERTAMSAIGRACRTN